MGGYGGGGGFGRSGYGTGGGLPYKTPTLSYYLSLVTSAYKNAPNFNAWLVAILQPLVDAGVATGQLYQAFDVDFAIGPQLDILGEQIGVSRTVGFQPSGGVSPVLTDPAYKILLKAQIIQNQWDGTATSLYNLWQQLFPGGRIVIQDNQDMSASIFLSGNFSSIVQDLITNGYIVPRPEGVLYNYTFATQPVLGFDLNNALIAGFDLGHWS